MWIALHLSGCDSREIFINTKHVAAVHGSFDPDDADYDAGTGAYEQTVLVMDSVGQNGENLYKVQESMDDVWGRL